MADPDTEGGERLDVVITEIGGTVGDIESLPFLEAARQVRQDIGRDNCFFLHVSLVPYIGPSGELKTKPTQHSVAALRSIGIQPDAIVCRADREIPEGDQEEDLLDVRRRPGRRRHRRGRTVDLRHPEGAAPRGPRRLRRTPARPAVPRRRLDDLGRPAPQGAPPQGGGHRRAGRQVHRPATTPTSRSPRRSGPAASPTRRRSASAGCRPTSAPTSPVPTASCTTSTRSACRAASASAGSTARSARSPTPAPTASPPSGLCLGLQCMVIEYARNVAGPREGRLHRVRPRLPRAGDRDDGGAEVLRRGRGRPRRHDAARALPGRAQAPARSCVRRTARPGSRSATATATR